MLSTKIRKMTILENLSENISKLEIDELEHFLNELGNQLFIEAKNLEEVDEYISKIIYKTALRIYLAGYYLQQHI